MTIQKLVAGTSFKDPSASSGPQIAQAVNALIDFSDAVADGTADVGGAKAGDLSKATINVVNLKALAGIPSGQRRTGVTYRVMEFNTGTGIGGHDLKWNPTKAWTSADIGLVWPDVALNAWNGTAAGLAGLYGTFADGVGCWEKVEDNVSLFEFGETDLSGVADNTLTFKRLSICIIGTGKSLNILKGQTLHLSEKCDIDGFELNVGLGANVKCSGALASAFTGGFLVVKNNGSIIGRGDIYTSGDMSDAAGSHLLRQESGEVDGVTLYSHLDEVMIHISGSCNVKVVGGRTSGFRSRPATNSRLDLNVEYFNVGIKYKDKQVLTPIVLPSDSRAVRFQPQVDITEAVNINVIGNYSWKNGAWLGISSFATKNLTVNGNITKSGYYLDANGVENLGNGAGTPWTIENAPDAIINCNSKDCRGYNLAITSASHRAISAGRHIGNTGDPNVAVVNSNDVVVGGTLIDGTVGVSVGEDGAQANGCIISAEIINARNEPVRVSAARGTKISKSTIRGVASGPANGSWAGIGEVRPVVRALNKRYGANDITIEGTTISGPFTHEVIELGFENAWSENGLRVVSVGNNYNCPIIPHKNSHSQNILGLNVSGSNRFKRLTTISDNSGYSDVGEISILESEALSFKSFDLSSEFLNLAQYVKAGETLADAIKNLHILIYFRYDTNMPRTSSRFCRFGLATSTNASHTPLWLYSIFSSYEAVLGRPLLDGEYIPITAPLFNVVHSTASFNDLRKFIFTLDALPVGYDVTITAPVVVEVTNYGSF